MNAPRVPLADLVAEYQLHPTSRHIYVEGRSDRAIIEWYLDAKSIENVRVFEIGSVEISVPDLNRHNLREGNKSRVIVLARELENTITSGNTKILCIVDADLDYILNRIEKNRFLANTDGASLESYTFSVAPLDRVLKLGLSNTEADSNVVLKDVFSVLREVFAARAVNEILGLGLEWVPFERKCRVSKKGVIEFDIDKFVMSYLLKSGGVARKAEFIEQKQSFLDQIDGEDLKYVHGHDYTEILSKYLKGICGPSSRDLVRPTVIMRMMVVALEVDELQSYTLFKLLQEKFENAA